MLDRCIVDLVNRWSMGKTGLRCARLLPTKRVSVRVKNIACYRKKTQEVCSDDKKTKIFCETEGDWFIGDCNGCDICHGLADTGIHFIGASGVGVTVYEKDGLDG